jgi:hypothetical protein
VTDINPRVKLQIVQVYTIAEGRGHFVGCCVSLQGRDRNCLAFLETPEYIFIDDDGESGTPTILGTGRAPLPHFLPGPS